MAKKSGEGKGKIIQKTITKTNIRRPRPRIFSYVTIQDGPRSELVTDQGHKPNNPNKNNVDKLEASSSQEADECIRWWSNLLDAAGEDKLEKDIPLLDDKGKEPELMDDGDDSLLASDDFEFVDDVWELLGFGNDQNNL